MSRRGAVCASVTIGAVLVTALATQDQPFPGLLITAGIVVAYSATVPAPGWRLAGRLAHRMIPRRMKRAARITVSAIVGEPYGDRPHGPVKWRLRAWHERLYFHLSRAEWDSRVQIGMSVWHPERLTYNLEGPLLALDRSERGRNAEQWDDLESCPCCLWPGGEWTAVIEEFWREDERRRRQ